MISPATQLGAQTSRAHDPKLWLWLLVCAGAVLRVYRLDFQSLWADEGLQFFVAQAENLNDLFTRRSSTFHPPLSLLINYAFLRLGSSDFLLRLPSMLFGVGSLPLCYLLAQRVTSTPAALFAVLVMAISPFHVWYSQEGRMYAQLLFLSLLSAVMLLQALEHKKWLWWAGYTLVITAGMYTHVLMVLGIFAHFLWVVLCHCRLLRAYTVSGAVAVLLCLPLVAPWLGRFLHRVALPNVETFGGVDAQLGFSWAAVPYIFFVYSAGFSLGPSVAELHEDRSVAFLLQFFPILLLVGVVFGLLLVTGVVGVYKRCGSRSLALCLLGLGVPIGGVALLSFLTQFTFNVRYTIVAYPYFCILIGSACAYLYWHQKYHRLGQVAVLAVLAISVLSLSNHFFNPRYAKENVKAAVALWRSVAPHTYLLSSSSAGGVRETIKYYLDAAEQERYVPIDGKNVAVQLEEFFSAHTSPSPVYLILVRDWHSVGEQAILSTFVADRVHSYPGVKILRVFRTDIIQGKL